MICGLLREALSRSRKHNSPSKALDTDTESDDENSVSLEQPMIYPLDQTHQGAFVVTIKLHTCVHGYLAPDKKQPASLIAFEVHLTCLKQHRRFLQFDLGVGFSESPALESASEKEEKSLQSAGPVVLRYAPHSRKGMESTAEVLRKRGNQRSANVETNFTLLDHGLKAGASVSETDETTTKETHKYFQRCDAHPQVRQGSEKVVGVFWKTLPSGKLYKDDDAGLAPEAIFAVLLQRQNNASFEARLHIRGAAGKRHRCGKYVKIWAPTKSVREMAGQMTNYAQNGEVTTVTRSFDPEGLKYQGMFKGIERNMLGRFADENALEKLTDGSF